MKICFAFMFILNLAIIGAADEIRLKDGSLIRGKIINSIPSQKYVVRLADGSEIVYTADRVESVVIKEDLLVPQGVIETKNSVPNIGDDLSIQRVTIVSNVDVTVRHFMAISNLTVIVSGALLSPASASDTKGVYYGGELSLLYDRFRISAGYYSGKVEQPAQGVPEIKFELSDTLYIITADYLFSPPISENGSVYYGVGVGYGKDTVEKAKSRYQEISADQWIVEGIFGYIYNHASLFAKIQSAPMNGKSAVGGILGLGFAF